MDLRLKEPERHRAVLIDDVAGRERFLEAMLLDRGILIVARYAALEELVSLRRAPECDLVIAYLGRIDDAARYSIRTVVETVDCALLVITETFDDAQISDAIVAGADAILPIGAGVDRLKCAAAVALASHERASALRVEAHDARRQLEERKLIERAKGILMQQRGLAEPDAFRELQNTSMRRNQALPDVARRIIEAKELLG